MRFVQPVQLSAALNHELTETPEIVLKHSIIADIAALHVFLNIYIYIYIYVFFCSLSLGLRKNNVHTMRAT